MIVISILIVLHCLAGGGRGGGGFGGVLPVANAEEVNAANAQCLQNVDSFESVAEADEAATQFRRLLPVLIKMWTFRDGPKPSKEANMPDTHERFNVLGPVGPVCKTPLDIYGQDKASRGQKGDEEKRVCNLKKLESIAGSCVIFSIGNNHKWGFEESIFESTNCRVETFDCTVVNATIPPAIASRVNFHYLCLGDKKEIKNGLEYATWPDLIELTGLKQAPAFLKMDIEGYEFPVMRSIIDSGVHTPLQIGMEVHARRWEGGKPAFHFAANALELNSFVSYMREFGGYYMVDRNDNKHCGFCTEILMAKLKCENHPLSFNDPYALLKKQSHSMFKKGLDYVFDPTHKYYD